MSSWINNCEQGRLFAVITQNTPQQHAQYSQPARPAVQVPYAVLVPISRSKKKNRHGFNMNCTTDEQAEAIARSASPAQGRVGCRPSNQTRPLLSVCRDSRGRISAYGVLQFALDRLLAIAAETIAIKRSTAVLALVAKVMLEMPPSEL